MPLSSIPAPGINGHISTASRLTAIVVDDEPLARQELVYLLEQAESIEILAQATNGIEAVDLIRSHQPDIVFLDVQMPGLDGFAVLKKLIDKKVRLPQVVFATAFDQYAVRAFEVNAVDYLLKPFDRKRVLRTIDKARARIATSAEPSVDAVDNATNDARETSESWESTNGSRIDALLKLMEEQVRSPRLLSLKTPSAKVVVRAQNRLLLVDQREICFASIDEGEINVVAAAIEGQSNCRTLEELMDLLDQGMFWRAHRSFVVNIHHIREVVPWFKSSYQLRMDDPKKTEIPVSRAQTKRLRELFNL